jgi:hypothetical protein
MPADCRNAYRFEGLTVPGEVHPRLYGKIFKPRGMTSVVDVLIRE